MLSLIGQLAPTAVYRAPSVDWHAIAPEIVLSVVALAMILIDSVKLERGRALMPALANLGLLGALIPVITLAAAGTDRVLFDGSYVVDSMSLLLKALFLVSAYVVVLISTNYVAEGDYWESEYYSLLLCSVLGMVVMASARDLIVIFVALELLSIPAYLLASWRKGDVRSNEAGMKYFLMGVFASAVMLYGMSLTYGFGGSTRLSQIGFRLVAPVAEGGIAREGVPIVTLALIFTLIGFAFKVSAVPFHVWAPDTYEGAPTPLTAFLAVASKAAGFVALINLVFFAFAGRPDIVQPLFFVLSVLTMTVANLIALRQTNIVRLLAYSGIAQAGFMLAPFAVVEQEGTAALQSIIIYLVLYAAMTLGAFAVVIAVARTTRSAEIDSWGGLFTYMPGMTVAMTLFLASLIGIPPFGGWYAKFSVWRVLIGAQTGMGTALAVIMALNTAVAAFYYLKIARVMWFEDVPEGAARPSRVPPSLSAAIGIAAVVTLVLGVLPGLISDVTTFGPLALGR